MKTVIFDLDGTLLNTIDTITFYANKALEKFGCKTFVADDYKYFVGNGAVKLIERALAASGEYTKEDFDKVFKYYNEIYNADSLYLTRPYDGIVEMLKKLKSAGIKTGVISNKPDFATVDVVKKVLGDVADSEMIIVGDSLTSDMKGGNNAGILCCWYNPAHKVDTKGLRIDYQIENLWDIKEIVF